MSAPDERPPDAPPPPEPRRDRVAGWVLFCGVIFLVVAVVLTLAAFLPPDHY